MKRVRGLGSGQGCQEEGKAMPVLEGSVCLGNTCADRLLVEPATGQVAATPLSLGRDPGYMGTGAGGGGCKLHTSLNNLQHC